MSQKQYIKIIERELERINRVIDLKILRGEEYRKEARDHKLLLKKIRYCSRRSFLSKIFPTFFNSRFQF
jgi:hypothetical protein